MLFKPCRVFLLLPLFSCNNNKANSYNADNTVAASHLKTPLPYQNIQQISLPGGYVRIESDSNLFAAWLRKIKLKTDRTVYLFNGRKKENQSAQFAVLDITVGKKDLQQCADAVIRMRAEYLFSQKEFGKILFTDNEGKEYLFKPPYNRQHLDTYLDLVFGMCGSASLSKQLTSSVVKDILPGDILIRGGFPGHAVIVMDVATNKAGSKIYLLAQSYMPAQDIHLLNNPSDKNLSPWYQVTAAEKMVTPEYLFTTNDLKKW